MWPIFACLIVLGALSLLGKRWAYVGFILVGLLYFPIKAGFHLNYPVCELEINTQLAKVSLRNYAHIVQFAVFFILSRAQFRGSPLPSTALAFLAAVIMGALVEIAEGATGMGHCRARDLIPDSVGALLGLLALIVIWRPAALLSTVRKRSPRRRPTPH
ncbi:MAG TPA: hypothetical protein VIF83_00310 [Gemmatimonadaceae bacterium]